MHSGYVSGVVKVYFQAPKAHANFSSFSPDKGLFSRSLVKKKFEKSAALFGWPNSLSGYKNFRCADVIVWISGSESR
jgi:hypothetical protein